MDAYRCVERCSRAATPTPDAPETGFAHFLGGLGPEIQPESGG